MGLGCASSGLHKQIAHVTASPFFSRTQSTSLAPTPRTNDPRLEEIEAAHREVESKQGEDAGAICTSLNNSSVRLLPMGTLLLLVSPFIWLLQGQERLRFANDDPPLTSRFSRGKEEKRPFVPPCLQFVSRDVLSRITARGDDGEGSGVHTAAPCADCPSSPAVAVGAAVRKNTGETPLTPLDAHGGTDRNEDGSWLGVSYACDMRPMKAIFLPSFRRNFSVFL